MLQSQLPQRLWVAPEEWLAGQGLALQNSCSSGSCAAVELHSELFFLSFSCGQAVLKLSKTGQAMATRHHLCPNSGTSGLIVRNFLRATFSTINHLFSALCTFGSEIAPPATGVPNPRALKTNDLALEAGQMSVNRALMDNRARNECNDLK
jgi:hypothetical protein